MARKRSNIVSQLYRWSSAIQRRIWSLKGSSLEGRLGRALGGGAPRKYLRTVLRAMPSVVAIV